MADVDQSAWPSAATAEPHVVWTLSPKHHVFFISALMSTQAKLTLAGTALGTVGIVFLVHLQQKTDKAVRNTI